MHCLLDYCVYLFAALYHFVSSTALLGDQLVVFIDLLQPLWTCDIGLSANSISWPIYIYVSSGAS